MNKQKSNNQTSQNIFISTLVGMFLLLRAEAHPAPPPDDPSYALKTLLPHNKVVLRFEGTAKVHARLGNHRLTTEGKIGHLTIEQVFVRSGDSRYSVTWTSHLNGTPLKDPVQLFGGAPVFSDMASSEVGPASIRDNLHYHTLSLWDLANLFPADRGYSKRDSYTMSGGRFSHEFSVLPHAATLTFNGRSFITARAEKKEFFNSNLTNDSFVYFCDEVPGRILKVVDQNYFDNGSPAGRTELSLTSAKME